MIKTTVLVPIGIASISCKYNCSFCKNPAKKHFAKISLLGDLEVGDFQKSLVSTATYLHLVLSSLLDNKHFLGCF